MKYFNSRWLAIALIVGAVFTFFSCSHLEKETKPTIVVTVSPYNVWVKKIVQNTANVSLAIPENVNPHIYEPSPKQINKLKNASVWFTINDPVETKLIQTLSSHYHEFTTVDLTKTLPKENLSGRSKRCLDNHYWLSPTLASIQCQLITKTLCNLYPEHAQLYQDNLQNLRKEFAELNAYLREHLKPVANKAFIISHAALGYFAKEFSLVQIPLEFEGKSPKPKDLSLIHDFANNHDILCALTLEKFDNKGTLQIANSYSLPIYKFNPNAPNYFQSLKVLANNLTGAQTSE